MTDEGCRIALRRLAERLTWPRADGPALDYAARDFILAALDVPDLAAGVCGSEAGSASEVERRGMVVLETPAQLAAAALALLPGAEPHIYSGLCPDDDDWTVTDPACAACRALAAAADLLPEAEGDE